jgi:excisionase family DNA binding protein
MNDDQLLTITETAELLRTPVATLRWWRHTGKGPRSFKIGRGVRYRRSDLHAWIDQQHQEQSA